jgi:integrase
MMVWKPEHTDAFLTYAAKHRLYALYRMIALRGLRRGEACGLRITDLDLDHATAGICWQITQLGWETKQGIPKTDASDRTIALDAGTVTALRRHLTRRDRERQAARENWAKSRPVFTTSTGEPLHPAWVTDQFYWLCYQAGLPPIRLHDLRHGAAPKRPPSPRRAPRPTTRHKPDRHQPSPLRRLPETAQRGRRNAS